MKVIEESFNLSKPAGTVLRRAVASFIKDITNDPVTYRDRWGVKDKTRRAHLNVAKELMEFLNGR